MAKPPNKLWARASRLTRQQISALVLSAILSAAINGVIIASLGRWLTFRYTTYTSELAAVQELTELVYGRRNRGGMLAASLRRNADLDEVKYRKRAYDETYNEFNTKVMKNLMVMRRIAGGTRQSGFEKHFQDDLTAAFAKIDSCLTKAYDIRLLGQAPQPVLEQCRMPDLYQFVLDCGATITNELQKQILPVSLSPFNFSESDRSHDEAFKLAEVNMTKACGADGVMPPPASTVSPAAPSPGAPMVEPSPKPVAAPSPAPAPAVVPAPK